MLAHAVRRKLIGDVATMGYESMHKRPAWRRDLHDLVMESPSVLAIGARAWDPLADLKALRLPYNVPVVVLLQAEMTPEQAVTAAELDVFSVIPADFTMTKMATCLANECVLALACQLGLRRRAGLRSLVSPPRPLLEHSPLAPVLTLRASGR